MIEGISEYIESRKYDFKKIKIKYTHDEKNAINEFNISVSKSFDFYGEITKTQGISDFLSSIGNNKKKTVKELNKIIINIIKNVLDEYKMEYFWITIRATLPNNEFDIPRWHKDGKYFLGTTEETPKFATVLKGPGTLFIKHSSKINKIYNECLTKKRKEFVDISKKKELTKTDIDTIEDKYRYIYATKFKKYKIIQVKNNEGVIFYPKVNEASKAAIHSEPKMTQPRLFISILPGTKDNIYELRDRFTS
jgi:hypothetical protein